MSESIEIRISGGTNPAARVLAGSVVCGSLAGQITFAEPPTARRLYRLDRSPPADIGPCGGHAGAPQKRAEGQAARDAW